MYKLKKKRKKKWKESHSNDILSFSIERSLLSYSDCCKDEKKMDKKKCDSSMKCNTGHPLGYFIV